jgi:hypothetical protein
MKFTAVFEHEGKFGHGRRVGVGRDRD